MSYQVLARKWRPQKFSELVGQEHVVKAISNALENDKLHHAYLFTGTRGVGKTTIARIFSKSLNCEQGQSANPCGVCNACVDIDQGRYVDLLEIDAASRTKVEDTRELLDNVQYKPTRGKFKVYLIDEVHMLSKHSFNALLKTLEEPPPHVKFLLATTDPQKLPITILSRCLQFSLKALAKEQIEAQLARILEHESIPFEPSATAQLAKAAQGSMRDALSLTDQAIAQGNNCVDQDTVVSMLGLLDKNHILKLTKAIIEKDSQLAMHLLDEICADAPDYSQLLSELQALLHQISLTQIVPEACKLESVSPKAIYTLSKAVTPEHIQLFYQLALQGKRDLPFAPDAFTGLQMTLLRMLAFSPEEKVDINLVEAAKGVPKPEGKPEVLTKMDADTHSGPKPAESETCKHSTKSENAISEFSQDHNAIPDAQKPAELDFDEQMLSMSQQSEESAPYVDEINGIFEQSKNQRDQAEQMLSASTHIESKTDLSAMDSIDDSANNESANALQATLDIISLQNGLGELKPSDSKEAAIESSSNVLKRFLTTEPDKKSIKTETANAQAADTVISDNIELKVSVVPDDTTEFRKELAEVTTNSDELNVAIDNKLDVPEPKSRVPSVPDIQVKPANIEVTPYLDGNEKLVHASQIDAWSALIEELASMNVKGLNKQLLLKSNLIQQGETFKIKINERDKHLDEPASRESVSDALSQKFNKMIELQVEYGTVESTPEQIQQAINQMRQAHAEKIVETDETIKEVIKAFDGNVIQGSIIPN